MARFRKKARRFFTKARKSYRKSGSGSGVDIKVALVTAGLYGAFRNDIAKYIPASISNALGGYGDEALLGGVATLTAMGKMPFVKGKTARSIGLGVAMVEVARVGSGMRAGGSSTSPTSDSNLLG